VGQGERATRSNPCSQEVTTPRKGLVVELGLHRSILGALGNSIVPQVAFEIIKAIKEADRESNADKQESRNDT
jgi:hypothetical protein